MVDASIDLLIYLIWWATKYFDWKWFSFIFPFSFHSTFIMWNFQHVSFLKSSWRESFWAGNVGKRDEGKFTVHTRGRFYIPCATTTARNIVLLKWIGYRSEFSGEFEQRLEAVGREIKFFTSLHNIHPTEHIISGTLRRCQFIVIDFSFAACFSSTHFSNFLFPSFFTIDEREIFPRVPLAT